VRLVDINDPVSMAVAFILVHLQLPGIDMLDNQVYFIVSFRKWNRITAVQQLIYVAKIPFEIV